VLVGGTDVLVGVLVGGRWVGVLVGFAVGFSVGGTCVGRSSGVLVAPGVVGGCAGDVVVVGDGATGVMAGLGDGRFIPPAVFGVLVGCAPGAEQTGAVCKPCCEGCAAGRGGRVATKVG